MKRQGVDTANDGSGSAAGETRGPAAKKIKLDDAVTPVAGNAELIVANASDKLERKKAKKALKSNAKALVGELSISFPFRDLMVI